MHLAMTLLVVFLLVLYSFAIGYEVGNRIKIDSITPRNTINPRFRLIYKNPRSPDRRATR